MPSSFEELTGFPEDSEMGISALREAVAVLTSSERFGEEMESANHHSMDRDLKEFAADLHVHDFSGEVFEYSDGDREISCTNPRCHHTKYEEGSA